MTYNIQANPEQQNITITGEPLNVFKEVKGVLMTGSSAILPFTQETAELLFRFLRGEDFVMSTQTKTYLRILKTGEHLKHSNWQWSLDLHSLRDDVLNTRSKALHTKWDLIHYMPLRYIDKSNPQNITDLVLDTWCVVVGEITEIRYVANADAVAVTVKDITGGSVSSWFFRQRFLLNKFHAGDTVVIAGTYSSYINKRTGAVAEQITNATMDMVGNYDASYKVAPVYSEKVGKKKWIISKEMERLLKEVAWIEDPVPEAILNKYDLMTRNEAYRKVHFPDSLKEAIRARERIAFDDFVRLQVFLLAKKEEQQLSRIGNSLNQSGWSDQFVASLPFTFTGAQQRVVQEIAEDMSAEHPMRRLLHGEVGSGKAQPLYSKILTPNGFTTMGQISIGDEVLTPDGNATHVADIFPQGLRPTYELTFGDGTTVHADENHLWSVRTSGKEFLGHPNKNLTTKQIMEDLFLSDGYPKWHVDHPIIEGLGTEWKSSIDPYSMGVLLGDESVMDPKEGVQFADSEDDLNFELRRLGLMGIKSHTKFIPMELLNADKTSRLYLIQGLLDTDGSVEIGRGYSFTSDSNQLAEDFSYLVRSLGGVARIVSGTKKNIQTYYVSGKLPKECAPFRVAKKKNLFESMPESMSDSKVIMSIEYIGDIPTQCIRLEDPKGLYITDGFTVTHNTEVSLTAALRAARSGKQTALLVPTGILATQLYGRFLNDIERAGLQNEVHVGLLHTGLKISERRKTLASLAAGELQILIGTHSILNKDVIFGDLGLIVIDEQHKFGTKHRQSLQENFLLKSNIVPDMLMMSATPIPRTMSQTIYGDMDLSVIDELPASRKPVITYWDDDDSDAWDAIRQQVQDGHQAYVIAALVEESESEKLENVENATQTHQFLQTSIFPEFKVGLVHGKMKPAEKTEVLEAFYKNEIQVLVSTSVIEVGVNVPNATVMTILNANRFGIASLHQIRGRVGRGDAQAYCFLIGEATNPDAEERLNAMVASSDGFWLAEKDLEIRGEGSLLNSSQSGENHMIIANLREHRKLLEIARRVAKSAAKSDKMQDEVSFLFGGGSISS